ncbi:MAG: hypothetical protein K0R46_3137 [Herbinix sp.]|nr:hypothetical protein [Herbinix sp.]
MRKGLLIISIVTIFIIFSATLYSKHTETRLETYLRFIPSSIENFTGIEIKNFELDRIIKRSPKELIILVKWDNNSAFVSIRDWLIPRLHDEIEIRMFDNKHQINFYE